MVHGASAVGGDDDPRPRVFISYAHDDEAHIEKVETLYQLLRAEGGVDAQLDLYAAHEPQDWSWWMEQQCETADYILVIASPAYKRRGDRTERAGVGLGVGWESRLLRAEVYRDGMAWFKKILLVILPGRSGDELPKFFGGPEITRYVVPTLNAKGIQELVACMTRQRLRIAPTLAPVPRYAPRPSLLPRTGQGRDAADDKIEGEESRQSGLDAAAWERLAGILRGVPPESWSEQAYHWSFGATGPAGQAAAPFGVPAGDLYSWAEDLGRRRHIPGTAPKAVAFAYALAKGYSAGESPAERIRAQELEAWADRCLSDFGLPPLSAPGIERPEATLTVRLVERAQEQESFYAEVWLRTRDGRRPRRLSPSPDSAPVPVSLEEARLLLEHCVGQLAGAPGEHGPCAGARLKVHRVEFAVPDSLLDEPFDQWKIRIRQAERTLGKVYQVVVRCLDQRYGADPLWHWSNRWKWLARQSGEDERAVFWVRDEDAERLDDLVGAWYEEAHPVCVAVSMPQARPGVSAALDAGMPVVVWQRDTHTADQGLPSLSALLSISDVGQLPLLVKKLRIDTKVPAAARASVVLLWDDPDHPVAPDPLNDANLIA